MFYTVPEISSKYRVTKNAVRKWIKTGQLNALCLGSDYRISESNLQKFLETSKRRKVKKWKPVYKEAV